MNIQLHRKNHRPSSCCPLCGGNQIDLFIDNKSVISIYPKLDSNYFKCMTCGLVFLDTMPSNEFLSQFYQQSYDFRNFLENEEFKRKQSRKRIKILNKMLNLNANQEKTILDIGCGHGFFLDEARTQGLNVIGIETSKQARSYAIDKLKLNVLDQDLQDLKFLPNSIDAVTMWHVIEHLSDPFETVGKIFSMLKPGGVLAIACPNISSLSAKVTRQEWIWLGFPIHLFQFSPATLKWMLTNNGFLVTKTLTQETHDSNSLPVLLMWHYGTKVARLAGFNRWRKSKVLKGLSSEVNIYHKNKFPSNPISIMEWLLRLIGNAINIIFYPLIYLLWKMGYGTEVIIYAKKPLS